MDMSWPLLEEPVERPDTHKLTSADLLRHRVLNNAACVKMVLEDLGVEELPESATFLAPFRNGPEFRWEGHDYQLTDLNSQISQRGEIEVPQLSVCNDTSLPMLVFHRVGPMCLTL